MLVEKCAKFIIPWEGFSDTAYLCPAGVWTIGYGHVVKPGEKRTISRQEARSLLLYEVTRYLDAVKTLIKVPLNENEIVALTSFSYNLGINALARSTLRMCLNRNERHEAADQFLRWVRAGGRVVQGLVNRRKAEREMFLS